MLYRDYYTGKESTGRSCTGKGYTGNTEQGKCVQEHVQEHEQEMLDRKTFDRTVLYRKYETGKGGTGNIVQETVARIMLDRKYCIGML